MTEVRFSTKDGKFVAVECTGHCDYADEGMDIVCAALSSVVQTAVLGLLQVAGIAVKYEVNEDDGHLKAVCPDNMTSSQSHDADTILKTAYLGVSDLYQEFSDYINLEVE
ncbi:MAG: ribosomal-processing cysteine protease Prp [Clostridia bacterium]|nr:ribosomal-processing cysteine protease Prp [Clostridia bacterium]